MKKTSIFKALALGLLSLALPIGSAQAAGPANCPAFNAAMVDAAALAARLPPLPPPLFGIQDDPQLPRIQCLFNTQNGGFGVEVNVIPDRASAFGENVTGADVTTVSSVSDDLSKAQLHACRSQVLQSLVWNQHCAPNLP